MAIIITYDIPSKHREFKEKMFALGYRDRIQNYDCGILYFPNTTLYHDNKTSVEARTDAQIICSDLGIKLERCVSSIWGTWNAVCGEPFK